LPDEIPIPEFVTGEALPPATQFTEDSARRAMQEALDIREAIGLAGWQELVSNWEGKATQMAFGLVGVPSDGLRRAQCRLRAQRMPLELAQERLAIGEAAALWVRMQRQPVEPRAEFAFEVMGPAAPVFDTATAMKDRAAGLAVEQFLAHPGGKVLLRHYVARAWAHASLLSDCDEGERDVHQWTVIAICAGLRQLADKVIRGRQAEAWLIAEDAKEDAERNVRPDVD